MPEEKIKKLLEHKAKLLKQPGFEGYSRLEEVFHKRETGQYLSDIILGANDGIITTFVVVAGASGASLAPLVILVVGFANVLGDAVSMGFGNYLGQKSEADYNRSQRRKEYWEVEKFPEIERWEIEEVFKKWGFKGDDLERAVEIVTSDKDVWVEVMMREELGIIEESVSQPFKRGLATFLAFVLVGSVPLIPFLIPPLASSAAIISSFVAAGELFIIGALRKLVYPVNWLKAGLEMLLVGALAGGIAYTVGYFVDKFVNSF